MTMHLTQQQQDILNNKARITVVRAGPGSGKTRIFVECLQQKINNSTACSGIAALSFTNVAQEEIKRRLGTTLGYPHFVGTLDQFLYRYVIRPFASVVSISPAGPRLVASPLDEVLEYPEVRVGLHAQDKVGIYSVRFKDGSLAAPNMTYRTDKGSFAVPANFGTSVLKSKRNLWQNSGLMTHSDSHYIGASILANEQHGRMVTSIIAKRFPTILVDELQDTGWFLGRALLSLLADPNITSLVVGDANQSIYEFGGANPILFDEVEKLNGASSFPLSVTQRCSKRVVQLANALRDSGPEIEAKADALDGKLLMLVHNFPTVSQSSSDYLSILGTNTAVFSRKNSTLKQMTLRADPGHFRGKSRCGRRVHEAAIYFLSGQSKSATDAIAKELGAVLFKDERPTIDLLRGKNISREAWRTAIFSLLLEALKFTDEETWNDWTIRIRNEFARQAKILGYETTAYSAKLKKSDAGTFKRQQIARPEENTSISKDVTFNTVHQVKGMEFDCCAYFAPVPHASNNPCPSTQWFPGVTQNEERRVAFVAVTRAKSTLILCIHQKSFANLQSQQPEFVALFDQCFVLPKVE